jgi:hypothetical protein
MDGTVITENCPVGWARVKQRAKVYVTAAFSLIMTLLGGLFLVSLFSKPNRMQDPLTIRPIPVATPDGSQVTMGAVAYRPTPTPVPKTMKKIATVDQMEKIN